MCEPWKPGPAKNGTIFSAKNWTKTLKVAIATFKILVHFCPGNGLIFGQGLVSTAHTLVMVVFKFSEAGLTLSAAATSLSGHSGLGACVKNCVRFAVLRYDLAKKHIDRANAHRLRLLLDPTRRLGLGRMNPDDFQSQNLVCRPVA